MMKSFKMCTPFNIISIPFKDQAFLPFTVQS
jgi:hypothetical protein